MTTLEVITAARKHLEGMRRGALESSAQICLSHATVLFERGELSTARIRAMKSIAYSVGVFHPDYIQAEQAQKEAQ